MEHFSVYFDSGNILSLTQYPANKQNSFSQVLSTPLDSRGKKLYASLQSIYIPTGIFNVSQIYTSFKIHYETSESNDLDSTFPRNMITMFRLEKPNISRESEEVIKIPDKSYTCYMLGVINHISLKENVELTLKPNSFNTMNNVFKFNIVRTRLVKVVCDCLSSSLFGGKHQQILRVIDLNTSGETAADNKGFNRGTLLTFPSQHMVRVQEGIYSKLSISLRDENDQLIQFSDETLTVEGLISIQSDF